MLSLAVFLPLATAVLVALVPARSPAVARWVAVVGAAATLAVTLALWAGGEGRDGLRWRETAPWIPSIGASYDVAVDGLSLPLLVLTALLLLAVTIWTLPGRDRPRAHAALFLVQTTGMLGFFAAQDLLLLYVFFELGLVPMYFIVGMWGHEDRRYAAVKFFLYTRAGSLAMLLAFLALYLSTEPRTFSLAAIAATRPLEGTGGRAALVLLGLVLGFGVKLPTFPLHNWLPDAHVEAPTEGSAVLAGAQLKMGGYGLVRIVLATVPAAAGRFGWLLVALGAVSIVYGALAALPQGDLKRLVAYTSVNHMGFVLLATGVAALTTDPGVRRLALTGATYQMVSHGLLTGGMFFVVGALQDLTGTRELSRLGGVARGMPAFSGAAALLALGSLGLPGLSGFVAELQVVGAAAAVSGWAAGAALLGILLTTAVYLRILSALLLGAPPPALAGVGRPGPRVIGVVVVLAALALALGVAPGFLVKAIASSLAMAGV